MEPSDDLDKSKDIDCINLLLYAKDRFGISNQAYHELSMLCKETIIIYY